MATYWKVVRNQGSAGVDKLTVDDLKNHLRKNWAVLTRAVSASRGYVSEDKRWAVDLDLDVFDDLDGWLRRKERCLLWRQWKRPKTRFMNLIGRCLNPERAGAFAFNGRGAW